MSKLASENEHLLLDQPANLLGYLSVSLDKDGKTPNSPNFRERFPGRYALVEPFYQVHATFHPSSFRHTFKKDQNES